MCRKPACSSSSSSSSIMSVFMDLNLNYTADQTRLQSLIQTAAHLGFSTVAINYVFEPTVKKKQEIPVPKPINELIDQLPVVQGRSRPIRVLNRLTVVMSDSSHFRPTAPEYRCFDLLAVQPTTEKLFHAACMTYDVDIICIPVTEKLPFFFKRAPINGNVILSSAAEKPLELRGPYDITNLGLLFDLSDEDAKEAVSSTCRSAVLHAETRKTASGIISTMKSCSESSCQQEAPPADCESPAAKKARPHLTE
ncbi:ribonuclease P protein subunit p30 isoform X3 [Epinephelus lanceolatus]|uniref:ribonuclease P protein subunit p30 isoform X3 n=1 Tax=Epinephelus lanceolatus TaxID=310571 RepID=UPI0014474D33|nr:ribonuclease P protein subunit p30 isoform X3 [Epinephelus lanceolatus]